MPFPGETSIFHGREKVRQTCARIIPRPPWEKRHFLTPSLKRAPPIRASPIVLFAGGAYRWKDGRNDSYRYTWLFVFISAFFAHRTTKTIPYSFLHIPRPFLNVLHVDNLSFFYESWLYTHYQSREITDLPRDTSPTTQYRKINSSQNAVGAGKRRGMVRPNIDICREIEKRQLKNVFEMYWNTDLHGIAQ